jgi:tetratricopeptide (TPR) repeat protein
LNGFLEISLVQHQFAEGEQFLNELLPPALGTRPQDAPRLRARGHFHASIGRWNEAADDFAKAIELQPENHEHYYALAALLVQQRDQESYRRICDQIRSRFRGTTNDPDIANRMAKACLMLPSSGSDLTLESSWADIALALDKSDKGDSDFWICKGLSEYRQCHFASAIQWVQKALAQAGKRPVLYLQAWIVVAMAEHQLKQVDAARDALAKGVQIAEQEMPQHGTDGIGVGHQTWINWIMGHALLREARALIQNSSAVPEEVNK